MKIERAWNFLGQGTGTTLEELIPAAMDKYGLNRVQLPLWLQQSLINGVFMEWYVLGQSGQRTSVKCAEAVWNYKSGGIGHLKSPAAFLFCFVLFCWGVPTGSKSPIGKQTGNSAVVTKK